MAKIDLTFTIGVATDFTELAKEKGYETGKQFLVALAKAELAHWRAVKKAAEVSVSEMEALDGEIT